MSSPNVINTSKLGEIVPPNLPRLNRSNGSSGHNSSTHTPRGSYIPQYLQNESNLTSQFNYSFINTDFIDDSDPQLNPSSVSAFRNLTSTPKSSFTPSSLPKSLPIDWNLFNKQFKLNQKLRQSRLKKRKIGEPEIKNNFENLPFQVIDFIADCVEHQTDLINLSQTCRFFNKIINKRLYSKIIIVDNIISKYKNYNSNYTLLDVKNYPKFLATLHSNDEILYIIKEIIIDTSSNNISYDQLTNNIFEPLYELFITSNNNLQKLENLDLNNLKKFDTLLQFNRNYLIKHNNNKYNYYLSQPDQLDQVLRTDLLNLQNFQLLDLNDLNKLPDSTKSISILIENKHNFKTAFQLTKYGWSILSNLSSLQLSTTTTFDLFINELYKIYQNQPNLIKLSNIKQLSISNIHKYEDDFTSHSNELNFKKLNSIIDLSKIEELELKIKCFENILCNICIMKFFHDWYENLLSQDDESSSITALSIINQSPSSNSNINIQWDDILTNEIFLQKFGNNLKTFFINLNDFPFIPIFVKTQAFETQDSMKLPINQTILEKRKKMYDSILANFTNLEKLIIPDFFYNWLVYNNIKDLTTDENLNYLNYLDQCNCENCCEARLIFKTNSSKTAFKDFKGRFNSNLNYNTPGQTYYNKLNDSPDSYRIFYNYLIRELKSRIPLKQLNKIQNSLKHEKFPPNQIQNSIISDEDFQHIIKLIIHSLRPEIYKILKKLPKIKKFNLGGILFDCYRISDKEVFVKAVYDDYNEVFKA
ncbi:hypothetical protein BN7_3962 [Wickerhamomyces ciferrii]|uniref:F-box domain-containing protein n=1 Tax=Wickerhamomyces ciferrii (strain ATCC 14091 / BCRC 22168 / CBS 111 / JCM 3599 / NBRC 0793 / NRRL Y-1031 F-60-10) TaxID=1206466 RepID=K0KSR1_WICCF|nr:uncharacterized protein BN7_3962 [Wickerhamomyces ciferrii]CCH44399.1 hypothetical protein BN7_3962 [Wickerhamomyces ciferrii]